MPDGSAARRKQGSTALAGTRVPRALPREEAGDGGHLPAAGKLLYIANALVDQHIGLDETNDDANSAAVGYSTSNRSTHDCLTFKTVANAKAHLRASQ